MSVARRGHAYPQVAVHAVDVIDGAVASAVGPASVAEALAAARRRPAAAVDVGGALVLRDDLQRAATLGLAGLAAARLARPLRVVSPDEPELSVRRLLAGGEELVVVREGMRTLGSVAASAPGRGGPSMLGPLARALTASAREVLRRVGVLAERQGGRAFLVGGVVRNTVAGQAASTRDLDVVVEGDGLALARLLAVEIGGSVVEHERFLTASVQAPAAGRIDIATARAERYEAPGALPHVMPSGILQDLRRRDFTVNAMALELASGSFELLDPHGGRADVDRRRLRVLHPLSFVEDPTRMFRAARYSARLGFTLDPWTAGCQALALDLGPYEALSGQRIASELELILREATAPLAVEQLGAAGVLRLLEPRLRFTAVAAARLRCLGAARQWAAARGLMASALELLLLALLEDESPDVGAGVLQRLGIVGEPRRRVLHALAEGDALAARLGAAGRRSTRAAEVRRCSALDLVWVWLRGDDARRGMLDEAVAAAAPGEPWLRGEELIALGVPRGPALARMRDELRDARLDEMVVDRVSAVEFVRRRLHEAGSAAAKDSMDKEG